jgi:hypothetical protein
VSEPPGENPYPGPRPFEQADRALFFGREAETRELVSLVVAHRVVLLYAASGAGKTSLLNAGVIPVLEHEEGFEVLPRLRIRAAADANFAKGAANAYAFAVLSNLSKDLGIDLDAESLAPMVLKEFLAKREPRSDDQGFPAPRVVIFDQFEELFTAYPKFWEQRKAFVRQIADALELDPPVQVVLAIREDHVAGLAPYASLLPDAFRIRLRVEGLRKEAALRAVTGPLQGTGRAFGRGVAEVLVGDLLEQRIEHPFLEAAPNGAGALRAWVASLWQRRRSPGAFSAEVIEGEFVEPVQLQVVCRKLWDELPATLIEITNEQLQGFGNVDQALGSLYDDIVRAAIRATRVGDGPVSPVAAPIRLARAARSAVRFTEGQLRSRIENLLITPLGTRGTVYRGRSATGGIPNPAMDVLEDKRLIRAESRAGGRWYELTHDRLIEPISASNKRYRERQQRIALGAAVAAAVVAAAVTAAVLLLASGARPRPQPHFSAVGLDFKQHPVGESSVKSVVLVSGSETLALTRFALASKTFDASPGCKIPGKLKARETCVINVIFTPFEPGRKAAVLGVTRERGAPLQIALSGTGVPK